MYYISRRVGVNRFGVIDTEDGHEDVLTGEEIQEAVLSLGIDIKGVESHFRPRNGKPTNRKYVTISVYQNEECMQTRQIKLSVLQGLELKVNGDEITSVFWKSLKDKNPCTVRLSDYGTRCADYLFSEVKEYAYGAKSFLTIVLDDKIEVKGKTFKNCGEYGIVVDIREVTNPRTAECVYKELLTSRYMSATLLPTFVIDLPYRSDYWKAVCVLNRGFAASEKATHISQVVCDPKRVSGLIEKKFAKDFVSISKCSFALSSHASRSDAPKQYVIWLTKTNPEVLVSSDYLVFKQYCMRPLFRVLKYDSTCNKNVIHRFQNYVEFFDVSQEIRTALVKFCGRANDFLVSYGREHGWI